MRYWADRYDGLEDTVYSARRHGKDEPLEEVEAMPEELADVLERIERLALLCQAKDIPLGFST